MNQAIQLGLKTSSSSQAANTQNGAVSWAINSNVLSIATWQAKPPLPVVGNGLTNAGGWAMFDLDPVAITQSQFTFGSMRALQITTERPVSWFDTDVLNFRSGRVLVFVPASGQLFVFNPKSFYAIDLNGEQNLAPTESENTVLPIQGTINSKIQLWIESDIENGAVALGTQTTVSLTAFNYSIAPVTA